MSQVSLGRPEFVPGTPPGHPTAKFLYVIFLYRFFLSLLSHPVKIVLDLIDNYCDSISTFAAFLIKKASKAS